MRVTIHAGLTTTTYDIYGNTQFIVVSASKTYSYTCPAGARAHELVQRMPLSYIFVNFIAWTVLFVRNFLCLSLFRAH